MDKKYSLKDRVDGKWFTFGNFLPGDKGPRMGLKVTPELRALIAGKEDGQWINLLAFEDDGQRGTKKGFAGDDNHVTDDTIPF